LTPRLAAVIHQYQLRKGGKDMELFSQIEIKYRDFMLVVNVPRTVFGFSKGDQVVFRDYSPGDSIPLHMLLAVSKPMAKQLEIGQYLTFKDPDTDAPIKKIRLWNGIVGDFHRDFDIHGVMIRPTLASWKARLNQLPQRCCPLERPGTLCKSPGYPCLPECPHISFVRPIGEAEETWLGYQSMSLCDKFTGVDYMRTDGAECCVRHAGRRDCRACHQGALNN